MNKWIDVTKSTLVGLAFVGTVSLVTLLLIFLTEIVPALVFGGIILFIAYLIGGVLRDY